MEELEHKEDQEIIEDKDGAIEVIDDTQNSTPIDPNLLEQLQNVAQFTGLQNINEVLFYAIFVIDILLNNEKLAQLVLLDAKNADGILTAEELSNSSLFNDLQGEIMEDTTHTKEQPKGGTEQDFMEIINAQLPNATEEQVARFVQDMQKQGREDVLGDDDLFMSTLKNFIDSQGGAMELVNDAQKEVANMATQNQTDIAGIENKSEAQKLDEQQEDNDVKAKVRIIALDKQKKGNTNEKMGKAWLEQAKASYR